MIRQEKLCSTLIATAMLLGAGARGVLGQDNAPNTVVEVRVEGNRLLSTSAVLADVTTSTGETYNDETVRTDQHRLLKTGRFRTVNATKTQTEKGVIVTFVVVERPLVQAVIFQGNKAFTDAQLAASLGFGASDPLDLFAIESGRQSILNKYQSTGYHDVSVTVDPAKLETDARVVYRIVEGARVILRKIRFKGNRFFSNWKLKQQVGISAGFWIFTRGYLDKEQMERDVHTIRNLYVSEGFLDANVGRIVELSLDGKKVTVTFVIDEGPRYRVARIAFEGNEVFSDRELSTRLKLAPGEYLTSELLQQDVLVVQDTYGELGYIEADLWAEKVYKEEPGLVDLVFHVTEADKYTVGRIMIRGNTRTQSRIIRRELGIYPEQPVNTVAIRESRRRVLETRFFSMVDIRPVGSEPNMRDILVQVEETNTGEIGIGAGFGSNYGLLGNIRITQRNFDIMRFPTSWSDITSGRAWTGGGQTLVLSAEPGVDLMRFHISLSDPAIFDLPYSVAGKVYLVDIAREKYDDTRVGGVFSLGHRFRNRWYGEVAGKLQGVEIDNVDSSAPPEVMADKGSHLMTGIKGTLVRDRTDSRWLPSRGDRFRVSYEQTVGDYNFGRMSGDYRIYRTLHVDPLDRKHIVSGRMSVGQILGSAPVFERFYGGGYGSVRGFDYRGISPRSRGTNDQIGGDFMFFAGAEYEFPIVGKYLRGVVFLDSGTVEDSFEVTTYRVSAGTGIRWTIPLLGPVPMNLDFGFPLVKDNQDDTEVFSFSIGWAF